MEHETRNKASEFTLLMSLSSFMIFLTLAVGNSGRIGSTASSSAIDGTYCKELGAKIKKYILRRI